MTQTQGETVRPWRHATMGRYLTGNIFYSGKDDKRTTHNLNNEDTQDRFKIDRFFASISTS